MDNKELELNVGRDHEVLVKKADGSGWQVVSHNNSKLHTKKDAYTLRNKLKKQGKEARVRKADLPEDHAVLVLKENLKGWRELSYRGSKRFTKPEAYRLTVKMAQKGRKAKIRQKKDPRHANNVLIEEWLTGDLDFDRDTMVRLAKVARDTNTKLHVNYGKRSRAEQQALWDKHGPGRAARPGTSLHETGMAADVVHGLWKWRNIGDIKGARTAMKKHGLSLPVRGEAWHVQKSKVWNA